jgi:hypothetical protein
MRKMYMRKRFIDRGVTELLTPRGYILSPKQQISLHFRCLVREHKFSKLAWYFRGIRRALWV